jgi:anti-anti-sigma factor
MSPTFSPVTPLGQLRIDASSPSPAFMRVAVAGEIDLATADTLRDGLIGVLSAQPSDRVEIDLAGVSFMDCTGLTALILARRAALLAGCQLRITNPQSPVRRLLELTALLDVLAAAFDLTPMPTETTSVRRADPHPATGTRPDLLVVAA